MKGKLLYKFLLGYICFVVLSFVSITYITYPLSYNKELKNESRKIYSEATYIASEYGSNYYSGSLELNDLTKQLNLVSTYMGCEVMLVDSFGSVKIDTGTHTGATLTGFDPASTGSGYYETGNFFGLFSSKVLYVMAPINYNFTVRGYVVICTPLSSIQSSTYDLFNFNYISMVIMFTLCGIFLILFLTSIYYPIKKIQRFTAKYAKGEFDNKIKLHRNDEIGALANSLDYMATENYNLNEYQKKFIANISHDFRSPLTSIKGYLEAMLDGTIPPEMQEKYLNIVISETERLNKLTSNLLTMNNMNSNGMLLEISNFDIVASIKHTIETFEGTCEKKKISFKLTFSDKSLFVSADMGKIQQVIYNLVDNAIKFSSTDSIICISATEKGEKIIISIKDFGIGIPKDSISKIWERFYKTDLSRGKDKKGTGLGLSIVKEIINAHKEYIDVISTEGVGTEFIFALPKSRTQTVRPVTDEDKGE